MTDERVEAIRRRYLSNSVVRRLAHQAPHEVAQDIVDLLAALAQAERERDEKDNSRMDMRMRLDKCIDERDAARAEVERLKGHGQQTKPHSPWYDRAMTAEANLARVRAAEREGCKEFVAALVEGRHDVLTLFDNAAYERDAAEARAALEGRG